MARKKRNKQKKTITENNTVAVEINTAAVKNNEAAALKKVGRPLKYETVSQLEKAIDNYFESCKGELAVDSDGAPLFDKKGNPVLVGVRPPTITGLALALGFNSRQSLLNYQEKEEFMDTITRAKSRVEQYTEERLFDKDGANGAKFSLSNNFKGWAEKTEIDANVHRKLEDLL